MRSAFDDCHVDLRSDLKAARISSTESVGCSQARMALKPFRAARTACRTAPRKGLSRLGTGSPELRQLGPHSALYMRNKSIAENWMLRGKDRIGILKDLMLRDKPNWHFQVLNVTSQGPDLHFQGLNVMRYALNSTFRGFSSTSSRKLLTTNEVVLPQIQPESARDSTPLLEQSIVFPRILERRGYH